MEQKVKARMLPWKNTFKMRIAKSHDSDPSSAKLPSVISTCLIDDFEGSYTCVCHIIELAVHEDQDLSLP